MWLNDEVYFQDDSTLEAEAVSIHFKKEFLGPDFFKVPEMKPISELLDRAGRGIKFTDLNRDLTNKIKKLIEYDATTRIYKTIELLYALSKHERY